MKIKEMIRGADKPITPRHEKWLASNPNPVYSKKALEFAQTVLSGQVGSNRDRDTRFRSSGQGQCERKQLFAAKKFPGNNSIDSDLANIFANGNFLHLKWQMAGLTEGWLATAEFPVDSKTHSFGGTLDGIVFDGSLFEFKSINTRGFANVCEYGPKKDHIRQAHGYMWLANLSAVSFVYEDKGAASDAWREFRVERDEKIVAEVVESIERMETHLKEDTMPEPLKDCLDRTGYVYRHCPFRDICLEEK